ncbi:MAG TPA: hypothetical protein VM182_08165 [Terriglobia bacterium]|nr:hypothetical protein [Terriglobia bacterium]
MDAKNKLYFGDNLKILREYVPEAIYREIVERGPRKLADLTQQCSPTRPFSLKVC